MIDRTTQHVTAAVRCWHPGRCSRAVARLHLLMVAVAFLCGAAREAAGQTELNVQLTRVTPDFAGFIRVQGGRFVDAQCSVFPVVGLNACAPTPVGCVSPACLSLVQRGSRLLPE